MKNKQDIFLEIFNPVKDNLWRFCLSMTHSRDEARDLLQETIETVYRNFDNIRQKQAFLSYMFTVASRINWANRQKRSRYARLEETDSLNLSSDEIQPDKQMDILLLYKALDELPLEQKEAIVLQDIMGFSQKEICTIQNITLDALKQRLYRGRKKLSLLLHDETTEENINAEKFSAKGDGHV